jgi:hypothetical protein
MTDTIATLIAAECDALKVLLLQKDHEHGNSVLKPVRGFSRADRADAAEQIKVRIDDKLSRLPTVGERDETSEDTIQDLIGYLVLLRVAQRIATGQIAEDDLPFF